MHDLRRNRRRLEEEYHSARIISNSPEVDEHGTPISDLPVDKRPMHHQKPNSTKKGVLHGGRSAADRRGDHPGGSERTSGEMDSMSQNYQSGASDMAYEIKHDDLRRRMQKQKRQALKADDEGGEEHATGLGAELPDEDSTVEDGDQGGAGEDPQGLGAEDMQEDPGFIDPEKLAKHYEENPHLLEHGEELRRRLLKNDDTNDTEHAAEGEHPTMEDLLPSIDESSTMEGEEHGEDGADHSASPNHIHPDKLAEHYDKNPHLLEHGDELRRRLMKTDDIDDAELHEESGDDVPHLIGTEDSPIDLDHADFASSESNPLLVAAHGHSHDSMERELQKLAEEHDRDHPTNIEEL